MSAWDSDHETHRLGDYPVPRLGQGVGDKIHEVHRHFALIPRQDEIGEFQLQILAADARRKAWNFSTFDFLILLSTNIGR